VFRYLYNQQSCRTSPAVRPLGPTGGQSYVTARAGKSFDSFDYQLGWPYVALLAEVVFVVLQQRAPLAIASVALALTQSPSDNLFLRSVSGSGAFARYKDAKFFCSVLTAWTFGSFLVVSYLMART
jgi:hypothetical protein